MIYIKPKFKIATSVFVIDNKAVKEIVIDSFVVGSCSQSNYQIQICSNNSYYLESICFSSKKEAQDYLDSCIVIEFEEDDIVRYASPTDIRQVKVVSTTSFVNGDGVYHETCEVDRGGDVIISLTNKLFNKNDYKGVAEAFSEKTEPA